MGWLARLGRWFAGSDPSLGTKTAAVDAATGGQHVTRPADWTDVEHLAALLERHRVEYVLIGGYALYANGLIRNTGGIDIVVRDTPDNNAAWIAALSELPDGAAMELRGETSPFPNDADTDDQPGTIRVFDVFVVDVMPRACGLSFEDLQPFIAGLSGPSSASTCSISRACCAPSKICARRMSPTATRSNPRSRAGGPDERVDTPACEEICPQVSTTFCVCTPSPSHDSRITSPTLRNTGCGLMPEPTPGGVPVAITSPACNVMKWLT
jgi:hypothetical protein